MAHRIHIATAWCDECMSECYHAYDESTGISEHLGAGTRALAPKLESLKAHGYYVSHRGGSYTATLYKAAPLTLPLEWQIVAEKEPEYVQDW